MFLTAGFCESTELFYTLLCVSLILTVIINGSRTVGVNCKIWEVYK